MRVIVTSDWHPDKATAGFERFGDVRVAVERSVERAVEVKAGLYLFEGDLVTNDPSLDFYIRCLGLAQIASRDLRRAGVPSIWMPGNHDVFEDGLGTTALDPLEFSDGVVGVAVEPSVIRLEPSSPKLAVLLPYPAPSRVYDPAEFVEEEARALGDRARDVVLVAGHLMIEGIERGSESDDMARGRDLFFPVEAVRRCFPKAVMTNGHYHRRQVFNGVHVPGSIAGGLTRGEVGCEPGFLELEL